MHPSLLFVALRLKTIALRQWFVASFHRFALTGLFCIAVLSPAACGRDSDDPTSAQPFAVTVSESPAPGGGSYVNFAWNGSVYRMAVSRRNSNGTSTIMWSWEVLGPSYSVSGGIRYGDTPDFADCFGGIHKCDASQLSRGVEYTVTIFRGIEEKAELTFIL